jgi:hypothetical protein
MGTGEIKSRQLFLIQNTIPFKEGFSHGLNYFASAFLGQRPRSVHKDAKRKALV